MIYSTKSFNYDKTKKSFSTMASDLGWGAGVTLRYFGMRSHRTGKVIAFELSHYDRDNEGDIVAFNYVAFEPGSHKFDAVIFND